MVAANWIVAITTPNTSGLQPRGIGRSSIPSPRRRAGGSSPGAGSGGGGSGGAGTGAICAARRRDARAAQIAPVPPNV